MYVAIHHHGARDCALAAEALDGHGDVVDGAEALPMVRERVMKTSAQVEAESVAQGQPASQQGPARGQTEGFHHGPGVRHLEALDIVVGQRPGPQPLDPLAVVRQPEVVIRGGFGRYEIAGFRETFRKQLVPGQPVLLPGEDVFADVQIVTIVIHQSERQHREGSLFGKSSVFRRWWQQPGKRAR